MRSCFMASSMSIKHTHAIQLYYLHHGGFYLPPCVVQCANLWQFWWQWFHEPFGCLPIATKNYPFNCMPFINNPSLRQRNVDMSSCLYLKFVNLLKKCIYYLLIIQVSIEYDIGHVHIHCGWWFDINHVGPPRYSEGFWVARSIKESSLIL